MEGICRLCQEVADLQESHVIPAFVFKWIKETSPTPYLRLSDRPNRRVQDGIKRYWLCRDCEQQFGDYETQFAAVLFRPAIENASQRIRYGEWLLKFCVSISWRALLAEQEKTSFDNLTGPLRHGAETAILHWHQFLGGRAAHPGKFEQHLLVCDQLSSYKGGPLPANINRYALRSIDLNVAGG
jgi:hypothetical protein